MSWSFETGRLASRWIRKPLSCNIKSEVQTASGFSRRGPYRFQPEGFARTMVGRDDADDRMVSSDDDRIAVLERSTRNRHVRGLARTSSAYMSTRHVKSPAPFSF